MTTTAPPVVALSKAAFRQRFRTLLLAPDSGALQIEVRDYVTPQMGVVGLGGLEQFDASGTWAGPTKSLSLTELRERYAEVMAEVFGGQVVRLTSKEAEVGALLPLGEFRALTEADPGPALSAAPQLDAAPPLSAEPPVVLGLWNEAGGAGKTTLASELAAVLANSPGPDGQPVRVLVIDLDPQRSLTGRMGLLGGDDKDAEKLKSTLNSILIDPLGDLPQPFPAQRLSGIDVIPAHKALRLMEGRLSRDDLRRVGQALRDAHWGYRYIIFDTPPSNGDLTRVALCASDYVVVPVPTEIKGLQNMANVAEVFKECREIQPALHLLAFVPMAYGKLRTLDREVMELLQTDYADLAPVTRPITDRKAVFRNVVPQYSAVVVEQPRSAAAEELREVTAELLGLIELHRAGLA